MNAARWLALAFLGVAALAPAGEKPAAQLDQCGDPLPEGAVARLGSLRLRGQLAWCLAFSRDGKILAAGGSDRKVCLWDTATGRESLRCQGNQLGQVERVALSGDGGMLATLDVDRAIRLWDARTGKHLRKIDVAGGRIAPSTPCVFAFSPEGQTLYAGPAGSVQAFAVMEGKAVALPAAPERGLLIDALSPDGATAVSAGDGGRLVVWEVQSSKIVAEVVGPRPRGLLALSPDARRLAVATADTEPAVVVFDLGTGKELCRCQGHLSEVTALAFAPDGKSLVTGSFDLTTRLWDAETGRQRWSYTAFKAWFGWVSVVFAPDGKTVAAVGWDGNVRLLDAATGKIRHPVPGHLAGVCPLVISPDGKTVFTSSNDQSLRQWEVETGKEVCILKRPGGDTYDRKRRQIVHADDWVYHLHLTPDGKSLAVVGSQGVRRWALGDPVQPRAGDLIKGFRATLSANGQVLATLDKRLRFLDYRTGKLLREAEGPRDGSLLCFSPDGKTLAIGCQKEVIRLYDARTLEERAVLRGGGVQAITRMVFSPDSQLLASSGMDWRVQVWEVASGQLRRQILRKESMMDAIAFSGSGRYLALGGMDRTISLHDLATGRTVPTFRGHNGDILCLGFTPDGRRLISGSADMTALVWDLQAVLDRGPRLAEQIARLVKRLDSDSFPEREKASTALAELGEDAAEALRKVLEGNPSPEVRRRAEDLLDRLKAKGPSPERLRELRALQVLEWIGTPPARRVLEALAGGAPEAERTRLAVGALARLKRR